VEQRSLMQCELLRDKMFWKLSGLHDAVVNKTALARLNNYDLLSTKFLFPAIGPTA